jgi:hypothetical protein
MDQELIISAITRHLDLLATIFNWVIIFAVAIAWAGLQKRPMIEALGMKFNRKHAFIALSVLYLIANVVVLILFLRLGDLIQMIDNQHLLKGLTALSTHEWVLNPFSFFGSGFIARLHSSEGFGLLIITWWICNASLSILQETQQSKTAKYLLGIFMAIGTLSMLAIIRVYYLVLVQTKFIEPQLHQTLQETTLERIIGTFIGIFIGGSLIKAATLIKSHILKTDE